MPAALWRNSMDKKKLLKIRIIGTLVSVSIIAAAITAYQYYVEHSEWLEQVPLLAEELQPLSSISCDGPEGSVTYTRQGDAWSAPEGQAAADALTGLTGIYIVAKPGDLAQYGLDTPTRITAKNDAGQSVTLLLGSRHGNNYYLKSADQDDIYLVSPALADALS